MALRLAARSVVPAVRRPLSRAFAGDVEKYGHIPTDVEQQAGRRKIELENEMKGEVRPAGIPEPAREGGGAKRARSRLARVAPYRGGRPREWAPDPRGSPASRFVVCLSHARDLRSGARATGHVQPRPDRAPQGSGHEGEPYPGERARYISRTPSCPISRLNDTLLSSAPARCRRRSTSASSATSARKCTRFTGLTLPRCARPPAFSCARLASRRLTARPRFGL